MKNKITIALLSALMLLVVQFYGQTATNVEALNKLAEEYSAEWDANAEKVKQYAEENNVPIRFEANGRVYEMVRIENGIPLYYTTFNLGAAHSTRAYEVWPGNSAGLSLTGADYDKVGVWDAGSILTTHQEFTDQGPSRVIRKDGTYPSHYHATHVGGTIAAAGVSPNAQGMAYEVTLGSWQWSNDNSEMAAAAAQGLELSNHSYGFNQGWDYTSSWVWRGNSSIDPNEDYTFGFYSNDSRLMDVMAYNAPNYLIVRAAGNDRGEGPSNSSGPENDGGADGFDCIDIEAVAKNVLTVGAVNEVWNYNGPTSVVMSDFSSWGPADDGRIKPDIVGKGVDVYSTLDGNNTDYGALQGTSMSSPNVTGSLVLLQQHYQNIGDGTPMRAATLKGLALHTADEAGPNPGPDYMFGWGLMNTKRAAFQISDNMGQVSIDERTLANGASYIREVTVPEGIPELRVTISWTDPAGTPVGAQLNPRDPMLVNDLDLKVVEGGGKATFYPYTLDVENPSAAAATDSKNYVDNIEVVVVSNPTPGTYTIIVDHAGSLTATQAYSLIVTGIDDYNTVPECVVGMTTPENGAVDVLVNEWLEWEPANFANSYDIYFGTDGGGVQTPTNVYNGENMLSNGFSYYMTPNTTYYLKVVPRNSQGPATNCSTIYSFTSMAAINQYPHEESFTDATPPAMAFGWQAVDNSIGAWETTKLIGHTDNYSMFCYSPGYVEAEFNNWLISPPFTVVEGKEYNISYFYKGLFNNTSEAMSMYWGYSPYPEDLTNLLHEDNDILGSAWLEGTGVIEPEGADVVFFGWHLTSPAGKAALVDDVMVEDWGPVGISPDEDSRKALIYNYAGKVMVKADASYTGADVKIMNLMGQTIYQGKYQGQMEIDVLSITAPGLFIVTLGDEGNMVTKKVLIK